MKDEKIVKEVLLYTNGECHVFNLRGELIKELCLPHKQCAEKLLKADCSPEIVFGIARDGFGVIPMSRNDFYAPGWNLTEKTKGKTKEEKEQKEDA